MVKIWNEEALKKLLGEDYLGIIKGNLKGKIFIFDKESYNEFKRFRATHYVDVEDGYLIGEQKGNPDHFDFFHIWLVRNELERAKQSSVSPLEVHHTTFSKRINIKKFLKIVTKNQHDILHSGGRFGVGYHGIRLIDDDSKLNEYLDNYHSEVFLNEDLEEELEGSTKRRGGGEIF